MSTVAIACASGLKNSGDEALLQSLLQRLKEFNVEPVVLSLDPKFTKEQHQVAAYPLTSITKTRDVIKNADFFVLGGGGLIQDETSVYNPFRWLNALRIANKYRVPSLVYGNSVGPLNYTANRILTKRYLACAKAITLRDTLSKELLNQLGVTAPIQVTQDPVFAFDTPSLELSADLVERSHIEGKFVFLSVRHWFDTHPLVPVSVATKLGLRSIRQRAAYDRFVKQLVAMCDFINSELGLNVVFYSFCYQRDAQVAEDVVSCTADPSRNITIDNPTIRPDVVMSLIRRSEFVVGMRLHSLIYSIIAKKPFIALSYSQKVDGLLQASGLAGQALDVNTFTTEDFRNAHEYLASNRESLEARVASFYDTAHAEEKRNAEVLRECLPASR